MRELFADILEPVTTRDADTDRPTVDTISLLVPTRQRPAQLERFMRSAVEFAERPDAVEFVVYVDRDDNSYDEFAWPDRTVVAAGDRITLSECWNRCHAAAAGPIFGHMGDDIVFRTPSWDRIVRDVFDACEDRIVFVHGADGIQNDRLGTHGFLHARWVDTLGYFVPPYFSSDFNDTWLTEVADRIGRRVYVPNLLTEHLHFSVGKAQIDQNTVDRLVRHQADGVADRYAELRDERAADAEKLAAVIGGRS